MGEGLKRVIGIMAAILTSLHMQTADELFGTPQGSPRTDKLIAASVQWAVQIMKRLMQCAGRWNEGCRDLKSSTTPAHSTALESISLLPCRPRGRFRNIGVGDGG